MTVHGYFHSHLKPTRFINGGVILFYSRNTGEDKGYIIGAYGKVNFQESLIRTRVSGFENGEYWSNLVADPSLSTLFTCGYPESDQYTQPGKRMVGQVQFTYVGEALVLSILEDAKIRCQKKGDKAGELKLEKIIKYTQNLIEGERELEYDELDVQVKGLDVDEVRRKILEYTPSNKKTYEINGKAYRRDTGIIALLKRIREYKCQICGLSIPRKSGVPYVEGAHITPKYKDGAETPGNILILCPNHHKEFDLSPAEIIKHEKDHVEFRMNGKEYNLSLSI